MADSYTNLFDDDNEGQDDEIEAETEANKEFVIFIVDSSPSMLEPGVLIQGEDEGDADMEGNRPTGKSHLAAVLHVMEENLKTRIISRPDDEVALIFFNTKEKKNVQEGEGVFVLHGLGVPTAHLIRSIAQLADQFESLVGSGPGAVAGSRDNPLKFGRKVDRRIFLFTDTDDPFAHVDPLTRADMRRLTIQRAKDAQDQGVAIELFPFSGGGGQFNVRTFYADMVLVEDDTDASEFLTQSMRQMEELTSAMRRKSLKKRMVRRVGLVVGECEIALQTYACIRPTRPATDVWLDAQTNTPLKLSSSLICQDTGAVLTGPITKALQMGSAKVLFTPEEMKAVKNVSAVEMRLLGFKALRCLKDCYNLLPPTFLYPDDQAVQGSMCAAIALHTVLLQQRRFAVVCWAKSGAARLAALVAQEEVCDEAGQVEPPGFQMIPLPFEEDFRPTEEYHLWEGGAVRAEAGQVEAAKEVVRQLNLKNFSMLDIDNPALQTHYSALQAMALEEEAPPPVRDSTLPDYNHMSRERPQRAVRAFKDAVFGSDFEEKEVAKAVFLAERTAAAASKRKAMQDESAKKAGQRDWMTLAKEGKLAGLTTEALKDFLRTKNLIVSGKKEALIERVVAALGL